MPETSIVMSVYNGSSYVSDAIRSVLNQNYKGFEFIIIDDGSIDESTVIISEFVKKDNRIKLIKKKNSGLTHSLNIGLKLAKGKFIARIDSDDTWLPDKLSIQLSYLKNHKDCYLVGTSYNEIDEKGNFICCQRLPLIEENVLIRKNIVHFNPFFHSSVLFKRDVLTTIGYYNEEFRYTQDYEFWVRIIAKYKVANLPQVLARRRYSDDMISIKKEKEQRMYAIKSKLLAIKLLNKPIIDYRCLINDICVFLLPSSITNFVRICKDRVLL